MKKINLEKDYDFYLNKSRYYLHQNKLELSLKCAGYCANIAYSFPFLSNFCDDNLELILNEISFKKLSTNYTTGTKNKYVFYDAHFVDTAGLTQQYLRYLKDIGAEVLIIVNDKSLLSKGKNILAEIKEEQKFSFFVSTAKSKIEKIKEITAEIIAFNPSISFLHFTPYDVVGYCVFRSFTGMERYFINLTDHAFWLGKGCADFFLEFRSFGYNLSLNHRKINEKKLLFNPYYPIIDKIPFEGFDFSVKNKTIGFIGTNLYKLNLDPSQKYLYAIKELLTKNKNFIFIIAGFGDKKPLLNFIRKNNLSDRIFLIGKRKDIAEVINNIDIYFNSYPFCGGLTTQFAVVKQKAIIGITDEELYSLNSLEDLLNISGYKTITNFEDLKTKANKLINDVHYRTDNINIFRDCVVTRAKFAKNLTKTIHNKRRPESFLKKPFIFNNDLYLDLYLNFENSLNKIFYINKIKYFKSDILKISIVDSCKTIVFLLCNNSGKLIRKFFKS